MTNDAQHRPFLLRKVKAPHWLQICLLIFYVIATIEGLIANPTLVIISLAIVGIVVTLMYRSDMQGKEETEPISLWGRIRTKPMWMQIVMSTATTMYFLDMAGFITLP